ncbi:hypothetical protein GCM10009754_88310 [Amycolatopsis minnesotensis]|uniref:Uncharacterized protein n=1 Tax=Amycolatopsis minnesotensis TaxID=337894 RepID=A0ABN2T0A4_9PSEU
MWIRKTNESEPLMKCRELEMASKSGFQSDPEMSLAGVPFIGQAVSGMQAA